MSAPVVWFEVTGQDADNLKSFYGNLFDWKTTPAPGAPGYEMVDKAEGGIPGGIGPAQGSPGGWITFYIAVDDLPAKLAEIEAQGGKTLAPPMQLQDGSSIAVFADPEGRPVGLVKMTATA